MTLNEYCEYIKNPLAKSKARVVIVPPGDSWTTLRRICLENHYIEVRLSALIKEDAWLPMPDEVFGRVRDMMATHFAGGNALVLLGMPGYLSLLTNDNKRASIVALREWVDSTSEQEAVCFLRSDDDTRSLLQEVFANPRYQHGKQLIEIESEHSVSQFEIERMEVTLVGDTLISFIPEVCDTFQKYLRYTEEHPNDSSFRRIVVASKGRELAGLSAEVRQVVCLCDFARVFYNVVDTELSEDALNWMCEKGKDGAGKPLLDVLKKEFFLESDLEKRVLRIFDEHKGAKREAVLWLVKQIASKGSYLERIVKDDYVSIENFRLRYVVGPHTCIDSADMYARERRDAMLYAGIKMYRSDILQFIGCCSGNSTSQVAPWFNCGTEAERIELLRRCMIEGFVSNDVRNAYPEASAYLNFELFFNDESLEMYFKEYRELKMINRLTTEFYKRAEKATPASYIQSRDAILQQYASIEGCALLVVDAMGAEWVPMLVTLARQQNIGIESIAIGKANLPTSTFFNHISWPDSRRLPDIKRFDNIAHNGAEAHETRSAWENLAAALAVIGDEVLPRVAEGLVRFERVVVTADHGSSRLAALAWQSEPRLAQTIACEAGIELSDWRYRVRATQGECPPEFEETLDGKHWVVRGYSRLPKKGGGQGFELHGGATLEERLVPVVIFSKTGHLALPVKTEVKRLQIVEKDDFDL